MDIDAGDRLVDAIKPLAASPRRPGANADLGGFSGLFDLRAAGYTDPLLLAATDGVGTKLKVAIAADCHEYVGIDLVALCVNDLVVQGSEPLLFLAYYATGQLSVEAGTAIVGGSAPGSRKLGSPLVGAAPAHVLARSRRLDLDNVGAEKRQLVGRKRPRQNVGQVDDFHPLERPHVFTPSLHAAGRPSGRTARGCLRVRY